MLVEFVFSPGVEPLHKVLKLNLKSTHVESRWSITPCRWRFGHTAASPNRLQDQLVYRLFVDELEALSDGRAVMLVARRLTVQFARFVYATSPELVQIRCVQRFSTKK